MNFSSIFHTARLDWLCLPLARTAFVFAICLPLSGCTSNSRGPTLPQANDLLPVSVRQDNQGKFMSPYTSDGVLARWVSSVIDIQAGVSAGQAIGSLAGSALTPGSGAGGLLGDAAGGGLGRIAALDAAGGYEQIIAQSDISTITPEAMSVYLYTRYAQNEYYDSAIAALSLVYREFTPRKNLEYIVYAPRK